MITDGWVERITLGGLVDRAAARFGDREALFFEGRRWTFRQICDDIDRAARGFIALGLQPGDKVALWMLNCPEFIHTLFGVSKAGGVVVPINTRFRTNDLSYVVRHSDSAMLATLEQSGPVRYLDMVYEACPERKAGETRCDHLPELRQVVVLPSSQGAKPGAALWQELLDASDRVPASKLEARQRAVRPEDLALIMYTSGTTGFPKGAMHNHSLIQNAMNQAACMQATQDDAILMYLPLFHAFGLYDGLLLSLVSGARLVLTRTFDASESLRLIQQEKATILHGFDTHFQDLLNHQDLPRTNVSTLRTGLLAASLSSVEPTARAVHHKLCKTLSGWGMTEVGPSAAMHLLDSSEDDRCLGSGYPMPGCELKVIDPETGKTQPPSVPGELCVRAYCLMLGYYKNPEETAKAIDKDGFLHSGDMAVVRADGHVRFLGRYKEMLKVGGENVDPKEVEAFLLKLPAIAQVKVVGVPDHRLADAPCACVILKDGHSLTIEEVTAFCKGKMASFKIPRHLVFVSEYPMTASGKVQLVTLRQQAAEALGLKV